MIRAALLLSLAAAPALAEGRDDPFLKCVFEDGREVVLAESGEAAEWREDGAAYPATIIITDSESPSRTVIANGDAIGTPRLDLLIADAFVGDLHVVSGAALLSDTVIGPDGRLTSIARSGTCEEFRG